jgi:ATP-dependent Clp protease adapter protein ClpS
MDDQLQQKNKQTRNTMVAIEKSEILEVIKQMPNRDRLDVMEFVVKLLREDINRTEKLSLRDAAEIMRPFYTEGSSLTEFVDTNTEDFYEYQEYA